MNSSRKMLSESPASSSPLRWITHIAFVIALAVVIARFTTPDSLRDPSEVSPGGPPSPVAPGPGTALVFDLIACLPAILALLRSAIDRDFRLTWRYSDLLLFLLAGFAVLSTAWSVDRFAAAVTSAHFFAAACLLWGMSQLVRSPQQFRLIAALAFGLLLVLVVQSAFYRFMDVPENIAFWNQNKTEILKEHNWAPDSFAARQFELKLTSGELVGFFNSANTLAATGVLLFFSCVGIGFQKRRDRESINWLALPAIAAVALIWVLICARSKTSAATPLVGVAVLAVFYLLRDRLTAERYKFHYWLAVAAVGTGMVAVIGHGLYHHGLFPGHFSNSLDFRWKYWIASTGIFITHPWIGVGWSNFGFYYLAHRLPEAAEEIKDPHNLLVRIFVELGIVGGVLCIFWLLRLAGEITQPRSADSDTSISDASSTSRVTIRTIPVIVILGMGMGIIAGTDFSLALADTIALLLKPLLYLFAMLLGAMAAAMLSQHSWLLDNRPAPLIFYCAVTGLGLFLLHNMIDFSFFEAGPMFLFMTLIGSAHGLATRPNPAATSRALLVPFILIAAGVWIAGAFFFVAPVLLAEQASIAANELIRTTPTAQDGQSAHFQQAAAALADAAAEVSYDTDYPYRQAELCIRMGDLAQAKALIARVKQINPRLVDPYLLEANLELSLPNPDISLVQTDFDHILPLNPNDVQLHILYGDALRRFGLSSQAKEQYSLALNANDALPLAEPKRLSPEQVADLEAKKETPGRTGG